ncbi:MAG: tetratricopeptide repeat protein [Gammaproteobacteria bacterium]
MSSIENFEKLLSQGQDNALLRYSLGAAYLKEGHHDVAIIHLEKAVAQDPDYSAAWKLYGKALTAANNVPAAIEAYQKGIKVAEKRGDIQAVKEMRVFLKRIQAK